MGTLKNLLQLTIRPLALYALIVLALSIPAYYLIIDFIWVRELDKHHYALKQKLETRIDQLKISDRTLEKTISIWNVIEPGSIIDRVPKYTVKADSVYSVIRFDPFLKEREQFRCLITHVTIHGKAYRITINTNMEERDETVAAIAAVAILFLLLLIGGIILLIRRLSIRLWAPFYESLDKLKSFSLENESDPTFPSSGIREFEELNKSLKILLEENRASYREQKEFTQNASHELQTPLAILQSRLDLLWQSVELTEEQSAGIELAGKALSRVSRINKNLLLLARIENKQFMENEQVDFSKLVDELSEQLTDLGSGLPLIIHKNIETGVFVTGNPVLIEILLNNLLINTIRHTEGHGTVEISLLTSCFLISNPGTQTLDSEKLFKRFASVSSNKSGSGLGLAIVKQIAERYGWPVNYGFKNDRHEFEISFGHKMSLEFPPN